MYVFYCDCHCNNPTVSHTHYHHVNVCFRLGTFEPCDKFLQFLPVLLQRQTPESKLRHHGIISLTFQEATLQTLSLPEF